jgi:SAM-dependent methyltransferase
MFEYSASTRVADKNIPPLSKKVRTELQKHKTVLDLGCVNWWLTHYIAEDANYIGISYSQADIDHIRAKWYKGHTVNLDKDPIPLEDASVDCIYMGHIVEHFEKSELIGLMNEAHRVLKKWGALIVATPTDYNSFFWAEWTHVRPYNHGSLPELLKDFTFTVADRFYPPIASLPQRWQALLRFPLFFLKDILWKEIVVIGYK